MIDAGTIAINGGPKAVTAPVPHLQRYAEPELAQLQEALAQNTLFYAHGEKVKTFCEQFAAMHGRKHCIAASSCTAAIHIAVASLGLEPGDEIITSPITDMGTILGMLWCQLIPVFADLDLDTHNLDPAAVEKRITPRTRALFPVHLAGAPVDMDAMRDIARRHNLRIIEDCAQSYLAEYDGRYVGTFGELACFSVNEYKHISCGDGGMVLTDDDDLAGRCRRLADKGYDRSGIHRDRNTAMLAMNYRMTELQGAVALAQLGKLRDIVAHYRALYTILDEGLRGLDGIRPHRVVDKGRTSAWFYMFRVDEDCLGVTREWFAQAMAAEGANIAGGYIPIPVYRTPLFTDRHTLGASGLPFSLSNADFDTLYGDGACPNAEEILRTCCQVGIKMQYSEEFMRQTVQAFRKVVGYCLEQKGVGV